MVRAENLVKEFTRTDKQGRKTIKTKFNAVDGISLEAKEGETVGILGPNGAGKTTLLRMLATMMTPTSGKVTHISNEGIELTDSREVKEAMGYLSNNTKLYEKFTVREMLELMGQIYGFDKAKTEARISDITERLNMSEFMDNRIKALSTGQTQRASIGRCLFADPELYILDEPTLGLDIMSAAAIVDFMEQEKKRGKTIIYSTHYLEEAEKMCDRIILINRGHVIATGSPAELRENTGTASLREAFLSYIAQDEVTASSDTEDRE